MASNGILIGKLIYQTISADTYISSLVGSKIYPIVAPNDTTFPFIVYTRTNVFPNIQTKDGWIGDKISFQITIACSDYSQSADLANKVRDLFENCKINNSDLTISEIRLTSISELFQEDTYIQNLYFDCEAV